MPDLDSAIRAELDGWLGDICGAWHNGCAIDEHDHAIRMRAAIVAVLDRHKPMPVDHPLNPNLADCSSCRDLGFDINEPSAYPCEEIEDIAKALGIEVPDV